MRTFQLIGSLLVFVLALPNDNTLGQVVAETTIVSDVLKTDAPDVGAANCDNCVIQKTPTFCQNVFNLPTTLCVNTSLSVVNGVVDCRQDGDFSWAQNLWIRKVRPSQVGEAGQECFEHVPKSCVVATNCKLHQQYVGNDPNGVEIYVPACIKDNVVKQAGWALEEVSIGDYCQGVPQVNVVTP
jgi:hypothetical protein